MLKRLKKTSLLQRRLFVVVIIVALAGWAKFNLGRFPYSGTWVSWADFGEGKSARVSLSFNANNGCSWQADRYDKGRFAVTNFPCSYKMDGDVANVEVRSYNYQFYQDKWRLARTEKEKSQAPLIMVTTPVKITSQKEGRILFGETPKTEFTYQGTDTTWSDSEERRMVFQKVEEQ